MVPPRVTATSEICRSEHPVWQDLGGEYVILDLAAGLYYGLDEIGSRVWALIQNPLTVDAIRDRIVAEFDVDADCCQEDLIRLLEQLAAANLILVIEGHA